MKIFIKLGLIFFMSVITCSISAYDFEVDGIYYNINILDKAAEVTEHPSWQGYEGDIFIPSEVIYGNQVLPVTSIGSAAFSGCRNLISIVIPNTITEIGSYAFAYCTGLTTIEIPNSVTEISYRTFYNSSGLTTILLPNTVTKIDNEACMGCSGLLSIEIPNSLVYIGEKAFKDCTSLTTISLPNTVNEISEEAFANCRSLISIDIPNTINYIKNKTFSGCEELQYVNLPNSINTLGSYAFSGCKRLTSINIPTSVSLIGNNCFKNCSSLLTIVIPNSVNEMGYEAFDGCSSLKTLVFESGENELKITRALNFTYYLSFQDSPLEDLYLGRNLDYPAGNFYGISPFYENKDFKTISIGQYVTSAKSLYPEESNALEVINCYSFLPPIINSFSNVQYSTTIVNIPIGSLKNYKEDEIWGKFWNIHETLPTPDIQVEQIVLNVEEAEVNIGETLQLKATVLPEDASDKTIIWNSSNENIALVSEEGLVTAISAGEATITATCGKVSTECEITVLEDAGVESLLADPDSKISIYTTDGILIKKDCKVEDLKTLNKGIFIVITGNKSYKIQL